MPSWPVTLPAPSVRGYALNPVDPVIRAKMEGGPTKNRRRFTQTSTDIPVTWKFTETEFAIFEKFHASELFDGVSWFDNIPLVNGQGVSNYTARFKTIWKATAQGQKHWTVVATLEVKQRPLDA